VNQRSNVVFEASAKTKFNMQGEGTQEVALTPTASYPEGLLCGLVLAITTMLH
jgi:hypothetical protein